MKRRTECYLATFLKDILPLPVGGNIGQQKREDGVQE